MPRHAINLIRLLALALGLQFSLAACDRQSETAAPAAPAFKAGDRLAVTTAPADPNAPYRRIEWEALAPADWDPMANFKDIDFASLQDNDPRAIAAMEQLRIELDKAPVNESMNGAKVQLAGFVIPLEYRDQAFTEMLLVPYFGACIHVPPPPANQTLHVFPDKPMKDLKSMDPVWMEGTLEIARSDTGMAVAGYRFKVSRIWPFEAVQQNGELQ